MKEQGDLYDQPQQQISDNKNGGSAILVIIRVRPLTLREASIDKNEVVKVLDNKMIVLIQNSNDENDKRAKTKQIQFSFDFAYSHAVNTKQIYDESISNLLDGILEGYNSTIFAYGATGCGKTFTMIGEQGKQGITTLAMIDLLGRASQLKRYKNVVVRVSYIQIYNQSIKDLLISEGNKIVIEDKNLDLREDPKEGMQIPGVTEVTINTMLELATVLKVGFANRSKEATVFNQASSRSHSLLLVKTECKDKNTGNKDEINIGKLTLVDLAGSERAGGQKGNKLNEGSKINKSLLALGNCIQVLADSNSKNVFVPYRESKLTRLLKQSLGGNCRTAMIVNITPFSGNWEQNYNSLIYANRAKNVKNITIKNVINNQAHISSYMVLIGNLKKQNNELKKQLQSSKNHSLPHLKSGAMMDGNDKLQFHRMQNLIDQHFAQQLKLVQVISQLTIKIDKAGFKLYRLQLEQKKQEKNGKKIIQKHDKNIQKINKIIEDLNDQKIGFQSKLEDLVFERGTIMSEIKTNQLSQHNVSLLITHYRQKKIQIQLQQIRLRQRRMQGQRQEKQRLVNTLGEQLKIRDKIIQQQKLVIQKNNIINRITYSKLGRLNTDIFPDIFQAINQVQKSILPTQKSQKTFFQEKSNNNQKSLEYHNLKKSISKKQKKVQNKVKSIFQESKDNASLEKAKAVSEQEIQRPPRDSIIGKKGNKIVRNKSRLKNNQLDFVYMQR